MKSMSKLLATTAAIAVLGTASAALAKDLKYAHFQSADLSSPKHAAALAFESCVEGKTAGSIDVQIYPAGQLAGDNEVMEGLQLGSIQMAVVHDGPISATYKPFSALALPYLFDDQAMAWAVMDGEFGKAMAEDMVAKTGIRMFGVADNGVRNFTNNVRPVAEPKDMAGLKMRVMTAPVWVTLVESLGASATPVPWPELPGALQQGVVDGQENGVTNIVNASLYQNQKYVTLDGHVFSWHAYLMSDTFYQGLTDVEKDCRQSVRGYCEGDSPRNDCSTGCQRGRNPFRKRHDCRPGKPGAKGDVPRSRATGCAGVRSWRSWCRMA
jgi:tripartite ATP-independent transporter DctP family solute receptor